MNDPEGKMEPKVKICPKCGGNTWYNNVNGAAGCESTGCDYVPELIESPRSPSCSTADGEDGSGLDLTKGVWFQATASGLWYKSHEAAGTVRVVLVNGRSYFKDGA